MKILRILSSSRLFSIVLVLSVFSVSSAFSGSIGPSEWYSINGAVSSAPEVRVLESDDLGITLEVVLNGFDYSETEIAGELFDRISLPDCSFSTEQIGKASLPVYYGFLAVPPGKDTEVFVESISTIEAPGFNVSPCQTPTTDGFIHGDIDREFYCSDGFFPEKTLWASETSVWRNVNIISLGLVPIQFNPGTSTLLIADRIIIRVEFTDSEYFDTTLIPNTNPVTRSYAGLYRNNILNYDFLNLREGMTDGYGTEYLILTYPDFESTIAPLAEWHFKEGFRTEVVTVNTTNPDDIKSIITDRYTDGALEYVLLVGDVEHIPQKNWKNTASDHWYACITGAPDYFADVGLGRFSVDDVADLQHQIAKFNTYETNPPLDDWLTRILFVAHRQDAPGKYVACKLAIQDIVGSGADITQLNGHEPSGTNGNVNNSINAGVSIVNYRGHGSSSTWSGWNYFSMSYSQGNVRSLNNGDYTPVVFNVACNNGAISGSCLSETWLDADYAAVASLGATEESWYLQNNTFDKKIFRSIYDNNIVNISDLLNEGNASIAHSSSGEDNIRQYLWLGDPTTEIWTDIPENLTVSHPAGFQVGYSTAVINVACGGSPVEDALVCIYKEDGTFAKGYTNGSGDVFMNVVFYSSGTGYVTVTGFNYLPYSTDVTVTGSTPDVSLTLTPQSTTVQRGGTLSITADLQNNSGATMGFDAWTDVLLPGGTPYPENPLVGPQFVLMNSGQSISHPLAHGIPVTAPLGIYHYDGFIGAYNGTVWDTDGFDFEIVP